MIIKCYGSTPFIYISWSSAHQDSKLKCKKIHMQALYTKSLWKMELEDKLILVQKLLKSMRLLVFHTVRFPWAKKVHCRDSRAFNRQLRSATRQRAFPYKDSSRIFPDLQQPGEQLNCKEKIKLPFPPRAARFRGQLARGRPLACSRNVSCWADFFCPLILCK